VYLSPKLSSHSRVGGPSHLRPANLQAAHGVRHVHAQQHGAPLPLSSHRLSLSLSLTLFSWMATDSLPRAAHGSQPPAPSAPRKILRHLKLWALCGACAKLIQAAATCRAV
jgi:hypothetical protein